MRRRSNPLRPAVSQAWRVSSLLLGVLVCSSCKPSDRPTIVIGKDRFNVVLITLDTTRADHLGCYGYSKPITPHLDRFAEKATLFTNAICTASVTPVSHASILTGLYPYTHGLRVLHGVVENRLPDDVLTQAEIFRDNGYATAAFISAFPAGKYFGLHQGFDTFNEDFVDTPRERIVAPDGTVDTGSNQRRAGETTDLALGWLAHANAPFFLWLHYFDPHDPGLLPPKQFLDRVAPPVGTKREKLRAIYDMEIQYMDHHIGRVFDYLEERDQFDQTIVVIVSDHGEGLGDHNWWTHGILYQEQIHAPLIVRAPGTPPGRRVPHLVSTVDLMPTIIELAGSDPTQLRQLDGVSLVPMIEGDTTDPQRTVYADSVNMLTYSFSNDITDKKNEMLFCVTNGEWKYIHHLLREEESELYHLVQDPRELHNLYGARLDQVQRFLKDLKGRNFMPKPQPAGSHMPSEEVERLRSLGYIE